MLRIFAGIMGVVMALAVVILIVLALTGCQTPAQKLSASIDALMGDAPKAQAAAGQTKAATGKTLAGSKMLDSKIPATAPYKKDAQLVVTDAGQADTLAAATVDATKTVVDDTNQVNIVLKPVLEENATLKKGESNWFAIVVQFLPVAILVGLALAAWFFLPPTVSFLKVPAMIVLGFFAALYTLWQVATMIPLWIYVVTGLAVVLGLVGFLTYKAGGFSKLAEKYKGWFQKAGIVIAKQPNAVELATEVDKLGTPGASEVLDEVDAKVEL